MTLPREFRPLCTQAACSPHDHCSFARRFVRAALFRGAIAACVSAALVIPRMAFGDNGSKAPTGAPSKKISAADRDAARALAEQGFEALQQGRFDEAISLFHQAEDRVHAPTHLVYIAKAQARQSKLLAAAETYRSVVAEALPRDAPEPFREAQKQAANDLAALLHRTPKLRVEITGADPKAVTVTVEGKSVAPGASVFFDPGAYVVQAAATGVRTVESRVKLEEAGGEVVVHFDLARAVSPVFPITALVVGGGAGAASVVMGVLSFDMRQSADCAEAGGCSAADFKKISDASQLRDAAIVTGIASGVALAAGITLLAVRPQSRTTVEPASAAQLAMRGPFVPKIGVQNPLQSPGPQWVVKAGFGSISLSGSF
ncbi:MAG: hypothetical protein IPK82_12250 [Polyangiaceae bacterium]|nr:hypothetical protein [Polyangiaceae bacterium]